MKTIPDSHHRQFVNFIIHSCGKQGSNTISPDPVKLDSINLIECPSLLNEENLNSICYEFEDHYGQTLNIIFRPKEGANSNEYAPEVFNETPKGWIKIKWWDENLVLTD